MAKRQALSRRPLSELLSVTLAAHAAQLAARAQDRGTPPLVLWANALRPIGTHGLEQRELPAAARLSKRAVRGNVKVAAAGGWLVSEPLGRSNARLRLTSSGRKANRAWEERGAAAEEAWGERLGDVVGNLRAALETVVGQFDLELPHYPQGYSPGLDPSIAGAKPHWGRPNARRRAGLPGFDYDFELEQQRADAWEEESGGRLHAAIHAQDWRPVPREGGDTVSGLPLSALLSQALAGISIDYEGSGGWALPVVANFLRSVDDDGFRVDTKSARAFAGLTRHEFAVVDVDETDPTRATFRLTPKGQRVRDAYQPVLAAVERRWKRRYGTVAMKSLRAALEATISGLGDDASDDPIWF